MAHVMTLTDLTTTFNLTSASDCRLLEYEPETPDISPQEAASLIVDGGEILDAHIANVTESGRFEILGTTVADLQSNIRTVELLFLQARERQRRKGGADRVYVTLQMNGEGGAWRSEILFGSLSLASNVFEEWGNLKAEVILTWTRRFYWEGAEAYAQLWNTSGGGVSGTVVEIYNQNAGSNLNFAHVVGNSISGSLPAACRIELTNASSTTVGYNRIYIGQGIWIDSEDFDHMLQGEDNEVAGGTDTSNATSSGGYYHALTWTGATTYASAVRYQFTISGAQLGYANGSFFRLLARMNATPNTTTYVRVEVAYGPIVFYQGQEMKLRGSGLEDFGVIQLPPSLSELPSYALADLEINIYARDTVSGSLSIDYIQLTPLDGWRELNIVGTSFPDGSIIYDDGILGISYTDDATAGTFGNIITKGQPIHLWPNRDQRLYILFDEDNGGAPIARQNDLQVIYRPRRLTL